MVAKPRQSDASRKLRSAEYVLTTVLMHRSDLLNNPHIQLAEKVAKLAKTTHKDRVSEFNAKLEALSEHHDIPKASCYFLFLFLQG
jgi:hypothetical protein